MVNQALLVVQPSCSVFNVFVVNMEYILVLSYSKPRRSAGERYSSSNNDDDDDNNNNNNNNNNNTVNQEEKLL